MSSQIVNPNAVTQSAADWTNILNALPSDGNAYATTASGAGYLYFAFPTNQIPSNATILGLKVSLNCAQQVGGTATLGLNPRTLTAQFAKDGSTYVGNSYRSADLNGTNALSVSDLGGPTDLWGTAFGQVDINGGSLRIRVQRPTSLPDEDSGGSRVLESLVMTVYFSVPAGGPMADRTTETQLCLIGKEVTRGTQVATTQRVKSWRFLAQPKNEVKALRFQGDLLEGDQMLITEASESPVDGYPAYDELGWLLASIIGKPQSTVLGGGAYQHVFVFDSKSQAVVQTYTGEYGDAVSVNAERVTNMILAELGMNTTRKDHGLTGKFLGQRVNDGVTISTAPNSEVQAIILNSATAITLAFRGAQTASLATPTAASVQTALQALATIGAGNATVSGTTTLTITFASALAGMPLPLIQIVASTGGTGPTISRTTPGGWNEMPVTPILPGTWGMYYATTLAGLSGGKFSRLFGANLTVGNRFQEFWTMDPALASWAGTLEDEAKVAIKATLAADTVAAGLTTDIRNRTGKYARLQSVGPQIASSGQFFTFTLDMACKVSLVGNFREEGKIYAREFDFSARYDSIWGQSFQITLINDQTGY